MELVANIYRLTEEFPVAERYGLVAQLRRAAVSIPSNIAEGAARQTKREFINFLHIAQGSVSELDTQLEIALMLANVHADQLTPILQRLERIDKMLSKLIKSLRDQIEAEGS